MTDESHAGEPVASDVAGSPMALYRLYDDNDRLLYVGVTHSLSNRFGQHAEGKPWWPQVRRRTAAWYEDRKQVLAAEARAIMDEEPLYNTKGRRKKAGPQPDRHKRNPLAVRLPEDLEKWLKEHAVATGQPFNAIVVTACRDYQRENMPPAETPVAPQQIGYSKERQSRGKR
jgi:hypothetical protein